MSRDIRSFFQPKKVQKTIIQEDDDIIPESPVAQIKIKKKEARKKRVLSDSDEEIFDSKKQKKCIDKKDKPESQTAILREVKVSDIFGNGPLKRTEPIVKTDKVRKATETGIHSDDEFEKSLIELDAVEAEQSNIKSDDNKEAKCEINGKKSPCKIENKIKEKNHVTSKNHIASHKSKADNEKKRKFAEFIDESSNETSNHGHKEEKSANKTNLTKNVKEEQHEPIKNGHIKEPEELNDSNIIDNSINENTQGSSKKKRHNKSLNESVLTDEERHERRMHSAALYKQYLNRSGPKHLGSKEIPEGADNCLKDCAFLLTGVLDSFERDEVVAAIVKFGGCIKNSISKKVTHVLAGEEPGPAKIEKARDMGIKIINEDEFLQIIRNSNENGSKEIKDKIKQEKPINDKLRKDKSFKGNDILTTSGKPKSDKTPKKEKKSIKTDKVKSPPTNIKSEVKSKKTQENEESAIVNEIISDNKSKSCEDVNPEQAHLMWVDKYKPQNVKQIIGQHGEASNVRKLTNWLTKWYVNRKAKLPKPSPWAKNDDGGYYKAALLSGPPGVGKTTTVALVCKELGFDVVEFNASDTRSKNLIKEQITELLTTTSLSAYAKGDTGKQAVTKKHVLVMDEVDGMAGNEDRGGLQELIGLIKTTAVPIICMCNDRNSQKMRSLVNYCYDLRFSRPRVDQIKAAMMSICFKEGLKVPPEVLTQLVTAANQDVRQTLHLLSVWGADRDNNKPDQLKRDAEKMHTDVRMGPWEAVRKVFSAEEHKKMTINDKSDLFFYDYSLAPLFVQENYLSVKPHCPNDEILQRVSQAADNISLGDLVDARIRGQQAWSLLPVQAMYSSVLPGHAMAGHLTAQVQFPAWLGRNSRRNKMHRLCQEIHAHTRLSTTGSKSSIFLDYSTHLRDAIIQPLIRDRTDGISEAMQVLESYHLLREDLDSLTELALWPGQTNPMVLVDSKVKAAMTRAYNKSATALPYAPAAVKRAQRRNDDDVDGDDDSGDVDDDDDSDPEHDALIKKKKHEETKAKQATKEKKVKVKKDKKKK